MAYKGKEKSSAVEAARARLTGMKQVDAARGRVINYGDEDKPCTVATLEPEIKAVEDNITRYNGLLVQADALKNQIEAGEAALLEDSARVLASAQGKFGRDSTEVEQLGGVRTSERARPVRKAKPAA